MILTLKFSRVVKNSIGYVLNYFSLKNLFSFLEEISVLTSSFFHLHFLEVALSRSEGGNYLGNVDRREAEETTDDDSDARVWAAAARGGVGGGVEWLDADLAVATNGGRTSWWWR